MQASSYQYGAEGAPPFQCTTLHDGFAMAHSK